MGATLVILRKDLLIEIRRKDSVISMIFFGILLLFVMNMAIGIGRKVDPELAAGILWISILFSSVLGLGRTFSLEKTNRCIDGLLVSPVAPSSVFVAKNLVNLSFMPISEAVIIPVFFALYGDNITVRLAPLLATVLLLNFGFSSVGTLFSGITAATSRNEVLLPLLLFPVITPLIAFTVKATGEIFAGVPFGEYSSWLRLMAAFGLIFSCAGYLLFDYVMKEN